MSDSDSDGDFDRAPAPCLLITTASSHAQEEDDDADMSDNENEESGATTKKSNKSIWSSFPQAGRRALDRVEASPSNTLDAAEKKIKIDTLWAELNGSDKQPARPEAMQEVKEQARGASDEGGASLKGKPLASPSTGKYVVAEKLDFAGETVM